MQKKISNLFSSTLICIGLFLFFYTFYKSEIVLQGIENDYLTKFYFLGITLLLIGLIGFFIKSNHNLNIALIIISLTIGIYCCEIVLIKFFGTKNTISPKILKEYPNYDQRNRYEVYLDEKKIYKDNVTVLPVPINMAGEDRRDIIPLSGHSNIRTVFCNELGFYIIYNSDRYGFRNPDNDWDKKVKYLLVGDSLGHGMCVKEEDTISGRLRERLPKDQGVLNLSIWGNGPLLYYATLREYITLVKPEKVLWLHSEGNDFTDLATEKKSKILMNYLKNKNFTQNLPNKRKDINELVKKLVKNNEIKGQGSEFYENNLKHKVESFIKLRALRKIIFDPQKREKIPLLENLDLFKQIIIDAKNLTKNNGGQFYFVDLPDIFAREYKGQKNLLFTEKQSATKEIRKFLKKNKIPYINIYKDVFKDHPDKMSLFPFRGYGHYNPDGYKNSAKAIKNFIENKK